MILFYKAPSSNDLSIQSNGFDQPRLSSFRYRKKRISWVPASFIQSPKNNGYRKDRSQDFRGRETRDLHPQQWRMLLVKYADLHISAPPVLNQQAVQPPEYDLEFNHRSGPTADGGRAVGRPRTNRIWLEVRMGMPKKKPQLRMRLEPLNFKSGSVLLFHTATV